MKTRAIVLATVCAACLQWTRLTGKVKGVNLKDSSVTIQNRDGDLLTVPVDWQVNIVEKKTGLVHGGSVKDLKLDENITLINTPSEKPKEETFTDMNNQK
jgi:hypothetical protein